MFHALDLALTLGLNFQMTQNFSLGLDLATHYPIYFTACGELTGKTDLETTDLGCAETTVEQPNLYFDLSLRAGIHF